MSAIATVTDEEGGACHYYALHPLNVDVSLGHPERSEIWAWGTTTASGEAVPSRNGLDPSLRSG